MALFNQKKDISAEVVQLREQGLTDSVIIDELTKKGYTHEQITAALGGAEAPAAPVPEASPLPVEAPSEPIVPAAGQDATYERMEEIVESMIDERWDELVAEVKKIVEWKEGIEEKQAKILSDVGKLKEDFNILHQGVLGKIEDYDSRIRDVGTELRAVGKVFKDVIPTFVENVKELSSLTGKKKK